MIGRIVLFGTPYFAERSFRALLETDKYEIPLIVTQPDKPSGRGLELNPPPVKILGEEFKRKVVQPKSLKGLELKDRLLVSTDERSKEIAETLNAVGPIDLFAVIAYGKIIPPALLKFPRLGAVNVHASLLPRWRGAAPIHRALAAGDSETGVCLMALEAGLDTGPVFSQLKTPILDEDNLRTLHDKLADLGRELLIRDLPGILSEKHVPAAQVEEGITYAEKWEKSDLEIIWDESPRVTFNRLRTCSPVPGARTTFKGEQVKLFGPVMGVKTSSEIPGTAIELVGGGLAIQLPENKQIVIEEIQLAGRRKLPAAEVIRGRGISLGERFGT